MMTYLFQLGGLGRRFRGTPTVIGSVVALMDPAAANNATSFTDEIGNTYTANGGALVKTGISGFGGSCMLLPAGADQTFTTGTAAYLDILPNGNFTLEAWIRFVSLPEPGSYTSIMATPFMGDGYEFRITDTGTAAVFPNVANAAAASHTWVTGVTYHVSWSRSSTTHYLGIDGTVTSGTGGNVTTTPSSTAIQIGPSGLTSVACSLYVAHRVTRGLARYTSTYTPPPPPFTL